MVSFNDDYEKNELEDLRKRINIQLSQLTKADDLQFVLRILHDLRTVRSFFHSLSRISRW